MSDLFAREQRILDDSVEHLNEINMGVNCEADKFAYLVKEYARLLKQLRRITKISDKTAVNLNTSKLDLLDKLHYDTLTGVYSRRFMEENLKRIVKFKAMSGGKLSILMVDVDFFKKYNDTYGHSMGDECLKMVASALNRSVSREEDFVARYGGEEFVVVLPGTGEDGARFMAERMLTNVRACNIAHVNNEVADCVTVSIGATTGQANNAPTIHDYIARADEALYISKRSGRNKYTFLDMKGEST